MGSGSALTVDMSGMIEEQVLSDEESLRVYGFVNSEIDEQLTWINYVMNQVYMTTGTKMKVEDVVIVVRELGTRVKELEVKQNEGEQ